MKILLTGGSSGGHFYPLMAVADDIYRVSRGRNILQPRLFFMAEKPFDEISLRARKIKFIKIPSGKRRIYFSFLNILDFFKTVWGIVVAFWKVFWLFPDVVFSKGGSGSFPVLVACRFFRIPIVIHESDSVPGRVNLWSGKFASRIAVAFREAVSFFDREKTAVIGLPIRSSLKKRSREEGLKTAGVSGDRPVILVVGGSLGAEKINDFVVGVLPELLKKYEVIHQTGKSNFEKINRLVDVVVQDKSLRKYYHAFDYLSDSALAISASVSDLVVSRAGSSIFEIAMWQIPSIIIPITESHGNHQRENAYAFMRAGCGVVIEESNLSERIFVDEVSRILENKSISDEMKKACEKFFQKDAGLKIASLLIDICLEHE